MSIRFPACFKNWVVFGVLSCKRPSCPRPKSLSDIGLINIFSRSVDWLSAFLMVTFKAWKCSILMKYYVSVVFLCCLCLWGHILEAIAKSRVTEILTYVSCQVFYSFSSYMSVFDPFWVDFSLWCEVGVQPSSFMCGYPVIPVHLLQDCSFLYWTVLAPLSKIKWPYRYGFLNSQFSPPPTILIYHWYPELSILIYGHPYASTTVSWLMLLCSKIWNEEVKVF